MIPVDANFKKHLAEAFTKAAIASNLITPGADNTATALEICKFYNTILNNIDQTVTQ